MNKVLTSLLIMMVLSTGFFFAVGENQASAQAIGLNAVTDFISSQSDVDQNEGGLIYQACRAVSFLDGGLFKNIKNLFSHSFNDFAQNVQNHINAATSFLLGQFGLTTAVPSDDIKSQATQSSGAGSQQAQQEQADCEEFMRDTVMGSFTKRLTDSLVDDVVDWIQGGGTPRFIQNPGRFLGDAADAAFGDVAIELGLGDLCDGPLGNLRLEIDAIIQANSVPDRFSEEVKCRASDVINNLGITGQQYYDSFLNGGWVTFNAQTSPQNNRWGLRTMVSGQMLAAQERRESEAMMEMISGRGFVGERLCNAWQWSGANPGPAINGEPVTLGSLVDVYDSDGFGWNDDYRTEAPGGFSWSGQTDRATNSNWMCVDYEIVTPGSTIAAAADQVISADFQQASDERSVGDYAATIADATVSRLVNRGTGGLANLFRGGSSPERGASGTSDCTQFDVGSPLRESCEAAQDITNKWTNTPGVDSATGLSFSPDNDTGINTGQRVEIVGGQWPFFSSTVLTKNIFFRVGDSNTAVALPSQKSLDGVTYLRGIGSGGIPLPSELPLERLLKKRFRRRLEQWLMTEGGAQPINTPGLGLVQEIRPIITYGFGNPDIWLDHAARMNRGETVSEAVEVWFRVNIESTANGNGAIGQNLINRFEGQSLWFHENNIRIVEQDLSPSVPVIPTGPVTPLPPTTPSTPPTDTPDTPPQTQPPQFIGGGGGGGGGGG